ncbi:hypothetical protein ASNO1_62980 [Corallococcus caeni]|uniref:Uncharacterized protein n=1 Tax=Corallococcus caeni TaxID=3082388 RepID=A0ABQ6R177_9BACT|nr:hypothetical protein ASNO1_62980 [Corallococcus sp. NO1]
MDVKVLMLAMGGAPGFAEVVGSERLRAARDEPTQYTRRASAQAPRSACPRPCFAPFDVSKPLVRRPFDRSKHGARGFRPRELPPGGGARRATA